uniref:Uncharacterized protein n=1 Tax=Anopheles atroparvus TaxID=41427 RepID=A0A182J6B6_ANOAO
MSACRREAAIETALEPAGAAVTVTTVVVGVEMGFTLASVAPPAVDTERPPVVCPADAAVLAVVAFRITRIDWDLSRRFSVRSRIGPSVPFLLSRCCRNIGPPPPAEAEVTSSVVPFFSPSEDCSRIVLLPPPSSEPLLMVGWNRIVLPAVVAPDSERALVS